MSVNVRWRPIDGPWPGELTPADARRFSPFKRRAGDGSWRREEVSFRETLDLLDRELEHLGAKNVVFQVALEERDFRLDGEPRAQARAAHPGVILAFDSKYGPLKYATDTFTTWQANIRAIALALEALRKVDRYGVTKRGEQYTGWKALPPGTAQGATHMTTDIAVKVVVDESHPDHRPEWRQQIVAEWLAGRVSADDRQAFLRKAKALAHPDRHHGDRSRWDAVEAATRVLERAISA